MAGTRKTSEAKVEAEKTVAATAAKADTKKTESVKAAATAPKAAEKEEKKPAAAKKKPGRPKAAATAKKTATAAKKAPAKTTAKKDAPSVKADVFIQFSGNEYSESDIMEKVVEAWEAEGKKVSAIKRTKLYIKPEEGKAYYVINEGLKNGTMGAINL